MVLRRLPPHADDRLSPLREHDLHEDLYGLRWILRSGSPWSYVPSDLPPCHTVCQQIDRWFRAGVFEFIVADLRALIRLGAGKNVDPSAAVCDSRTLWGGVENSGTGGYHGHKRRRAGSCTWRSTRWTSFLRWW